MVAKQAQAALCLSLPRTKSRASQSIIDRLGRIGKMAAF